MQIQELWKAHERMNGLRNLLGYVENGSDTVVTIFQDDATKDFIVKVGKCTYYATTLGEALDEAISDLGREV